MCGYIYIKQASCFSFLALLLMMIVKISVINVRVKIGIL